METWIPRYIQSGAIQALCAMRVEDRGARWRNEKPYKGIASRAFERVFQLADYVQVKGAALKNGLLHVDLVREIPEAKKPRAIPIGGGQPKVVEAKAAA